VLRLADIINSYSDKEVEKEVITSFARHKRKLLRPYYLT